MGRGKCWRLAGAGISAVKSAGAGPRLPEGDGLGPGLEGGGLGDGALELVPVDGAVVVRVHLAPQRGSEGNGLESVDTGDAENWRSTSKSHLSIDFFELVVTADRNFE